MNKEEFKKEVYPLSENMYRLSLRLLNDTELAKDCVQESFVKLWENRSRLKKVNNIQAFAFSIIRNMSVDKLRKAKRINEFAKNTVIQVTESNYEFIESKDLIKKVIQSLPHQQRLIIELRDIEEFSYEEIAETLDITVNNIRVNLSITRKKVKEEIIKIYNYGLAKD